MQTAHEVMAKEGFRPFKVEVMIVPPTFMVELGLATVHRETVTVYGKSLADAKKRAGIE